MVRQYTPDECTCSYPSVPHWLVKLTLRVTHDHSSLFQPVQSVWDSWWGLWLTLVKPHTGSELLESLSGDRARKHHGKPEKDW